MLSICLLLSAVACVTGYAAKSDLSFLVMGDWGGKPHDPFITAPEVNTARSMNEVARNYSAKFALALGDNFYESGVRSVTDHRFQSTFEDCFAGDALSAHNKFVFHVTAGNHDHRGNVDAQIEYSGQSKRWSFPDLWYTFTETAPDGATVQIVMIDTVVLAGNSQWNDEDVDPILGSQLPGPVNFTAAKAQLDLIETTLANSAADFLIVAGHYPVFYVAEHGPTNALQPDRFPYLRQHNVSAYLNGHEHND
jgi:tartrate-resistant acid phosphatase type 5